MLFRKKSAPKNHLGVCAEKWAQQYLESQGLSLIGCNYKAPRGEIDLIMQEGPTLVFIEVRLRSTNKYGSAADSINYRKQQSIIHTAQYFLQVEKKWNQTICRFDTICLDKDPGNDQKYQVEWLRNAFSV